MLSCSAALAHVHMHPPGRGMSRMERGRVNKRTRPPVKFCVEINFRWRLCLERLPQRLGVRHLGVVAVGEGSGAGNVARSVQFA